ncbi:hypothetical protein [Pseudomonas sp. Marseille-QA0892]
MALAHGLGIWGLGSGRALERAIDAYRHGQLDEQRLQAIGDAIRTRHWKAQYDAGHAFVTVGDFTWRDPVLAHSALVGALPSAGRVVEEECPLATLLEVHANAAKRGALGRWFNTAMELVPPLLTADAQFGLKPAALLQEVEQARALGYAVKPVVLGPLTYLWLGQACSSQDDVLGLLDRLLPVYGTLFTRFAEQGVEWVQIDEPLLTQDLPPAWTSAYERAYNLLQKEPLKKLVACGFGKLDANLGLAASLPVDGLHVDIEGDYSRLVRVLDRIHGYKVLSLGLVSGANSDSDSEHAKALAREAHERIGDRLWVSAVSAVYADEPDNADSAGPRGGIATFAKASALAAQIAASASDGFGRSSEAA